MTAKGNFYADWRSDLEQASDRAQQAQEECARDPDAFFARLGRLSREQDAASIIARFKLNVTPQELLDLWERWTASCALIGAIRCNNITRMCPCEDCVELRKECREALGPKWKSILQSDTLSLTDGLLVGRDRKWKRGDYSQPKSPGHAQHIREAWVIRKLHAQVLSSCDMCRNDPQVALSGGCPHKARVSPQAVGVDGRLLASSDLSQPRKPGSPNGDIVPSERHQKNRSQKDG